LVAASPYIWAGRRGDMQLAVGLGLSVVNALVIYFISLSIIKSLRHVLSVILLFIVLVPQGFAPHCRQIGRWYILWVFAFAR
jgi:hypothetical protein